MEPPPHRAGQSIAGASGCPRRGSDGAAGAAGAADAMAASAAFGPSRDDSDGVAPSWRQHTLALDGDIERAIRHTQGGSSLQIRPNATQQPPPSQRQQHRAAPKPPATASSPRSPAVEFSDVGGDSDGTGPMLLSSTLLRPEPRKVPGEDAAGSSNNLRPSAAREQQQQPQQQQPTVVVEWPDGDADHRPRSFLRVAEPSSATSSPPMLAQRVHAPPAERLVLEQQPDAKARAKKSKHDREAEAATASAQAAFASSAPASSANLAALRNRLASCSAANLGVLRDIERGESRRSFAKTRGDATDGSNHAIQTAANDHAATIRQTSPQSQFLQVPGAPAAGSSKTHSTVKRHSAADHHRNGHSMVGFAPDGTPIALEVITVESVADSDESKSDLSFRRGRLGKPSVVSAAGGATAMSTLGTNGGTGSTTARHSNAAPEASRSAKTVASTRAPSSVINDEGRLELAEESNAPVRQHGNHHRSSRRSTLPAHSHLLSPKDRDDGHTTAHGQRRHHHRRDAAVAQGPESHHLNATSDSYDEDTHSDSSRSTSSSIGAGQRESSERRLEAMRHDLRKSRREFDREERQWREREGGAGYVESKRFSPSRTRHPHHNRFGTERSSSSARQHHQPHSTALVAHPAAADPSQSRHRSPASSRRRSPSASAQHQRHHHHHRSWGDEEDRLQSAGDDHFGHTDEDFGHDQAAARAAMLEKQHAVRKLLWSMDDRLR